MCDLNHCILMYYTFKIAGKTRLFIVFSSNENQNAEFNGKLCYAFTQPTASSAYLVSLLSSTVSSGLSRVNHDLASSYSTTLVYSIEDLWKSLVSFCFLPSYASCLLYLSIFCLLYYRAATLILCNTGSGI